MEIIALFGWLDQPPLVDYLLLYLHGFVSGKETSASGWGLLFPQPNRPIYICYAIYIVIMDNLIASKMFLNYH